MQDIGFNLVNLQELNLSSNKIDHVGKIIGYPKLQNLSLDNNPIVAIEPSAFRDCAGLEHLSICSI
jgi:Leucine-rich repeat (LRR) protein